jgi:hypothetical protein
MKRWCNVWFHNKTSRSYNDIKNEYAKCRSKLNL